MAQFSLLAWIFPERIFKKSVETLRKTLNDSSLEPTSWPHISIAFIQVPLSKEQKEHLLDIAKKFKGTYNIKGLHVLEGLSTPKDYISYDLSTPPQHLEFLKYLNSYLGEGAVRKFDKVKPHCSLASVPKNNDEIDVNTLNKELKQYWSSITPDRITFWQNFEISDIAEAGYTIVTD